jgi:hypothetical protein
MYSGTRPRPSQGKCITHCNHMTLFATPRCSICRIFATLPSEGLLLHCSRGNSLQVPGPARHTTYRTANRPATLTQRFCFGATLYTFQGARVLPCQCMPSVHRWHALALHRRCPCGHNLPLPPCFHPGLHFAALGGLLGALQQCALQVQFKIGVVVHF